MAGYPWAVSFSGGALESYGACSSEQVNYFFFSPMALTTRGFIFSDGDIWFNLDVSTIQNVVWVPVNP